MRALGRRVPSDWGHVERHRLLAQPRPQVVERILDVPRQYRASYDQRAEGACVGFSQSWMMSIMNRKRYDARWLYQQAQGVDEYPDTPPAEGTSLRAGFDILRRLGHRRVWGGLSWPAHPRHGIAANGWARSADEVATAIHRGTPVNLGVNWYRQFSRPEAKWHEHWIGQGADWGPVDGGHAITAVGASDARQAVALCNTWGDEYPWLVWLPYASLERLLAEDGEAGVVVDR